MKTLLFAVALQLQILQTPLVPVAPGPKGSIEGVVITADNRPVAGAEVSAFWSPSPSAYRPTELPRATSDSDGRFAIRDLGAGGYRIHVKAPGYALQEYGTSLPGNQGMNTGTVVDVAPGESKQGFTIRIVKDGIISGRITSTTGSPLLGMEVFAMRKAFDQTGWRSFVTEGGRGDTNDRGEYRITGLPPGRYYIRAASQPSFLAAVAGARILSADGLRVENTVAPSPGQYAPMYHPGTPEPDNARQIEVNSGMESTNVDISLPRAALFSIRGRVVDPTETKPPERVMLGTMPARADFVSSVGTSVTPYRPDGSFELPDITPGTYWVNALLSTPLTPEQRQAMTTPGADRSKFPVSPRGTALVTVNNSDVENVEVTIVRDLRVTGSVSVEGRSITPEELASLKVELRPVEVVMLGQKPVGDVTMNPDATFVYRNISPADYRATLSGPGRPLPEGRQTGRHRRIEPAHHADNPSTSTIELCPGQGGELVGTVRDSSKAVPGQQVVLIPEGRPGRPDFYKTATTDGNGRFVVRDVAPGDYRVYAWKTMGPFQYFDPEFMRDFTDKGTAVHIVGSPAATAEVSLILN